MTVLMTYEVKDLIQTIFMSGGICIALPITLVAIGIGCLVSYFVGRKMLAPEIRAEEDKISK